MKVRIVIMAKAPLPGLAKTRLAAAIGEEKATALARRMLWRALATARRSALGPVELCTTPDEDFPDVTAAARFAGAVLTHQGDGDLGTRMARIAERALQAGERPIILGTDCTAMASRHLRQAALALEAHPAAFLPAADGGYVLVGLGVLHRRLFEAMPWGTAEVMAMTRQRLRELGWCWWEGETLHDVDTAEDLVHLPESWRIS